MKEARAEPGRGSGRSLKEKLGLGGARTNRDGLPLPRAHFFRLHPHRTLTDWSSILSLKDEVPVGRSPYGRADKDFETSKLVRIE